MNGSYTSQLTVNVSQHLNGSTTECASDSGTQFDSRQILLITGMFNSLTNIMHVAAIHL